ncbi:MAG TPA: FtsX-like permease family protein, partial [Micromonosporaceae bacterium]|nr:FtsX-like permease family protein [Micromonosporaceae bacterium]
RGLSQAGVDPYLSAVPVLVGTAVGLLALRVYPWPVRLLDRLAARRTGVAFLGLARAGRAPAAAALPLIVIVLAVAVGGFAGTVRTGIAVARNEAAARAVGGDLRLSAAEFAADSAARVAAVPGVTGVASGYLVAPGMLRAGEDAADPQVVLVALDLRAYQQILTSIGLDVRLPADLLDAGAAGDLPAIASPGAARLPGLVARLGTTERPIRIVDTRRALPGLDRAEFVVVPREAVADPAAVTNLLFVAGPAADPAAVRAAAPVVAKNAALEPLLTAGLFAADGSVTVLSRAEQRIALEHSAFNDGISLAFTAGTAAALLAGLLAIGLALVVDARARGRTLSLLRTMGLGPRQARGLLLVELVPLMVTALAAGGALGVALPRLLAPALGLTAFTAGTPLPIGLDGTTTALLAGLLLMFVTGGVLTEAAANRRLGLGQVLRV